MTTITPTPEILRAVEYVGLLDQLGASESLQTDHDDYPADYLLRTAAAAIGSVVAGHHGTGSWAASHALRKLSVTDVTVLLMAYGATRLTIELHASRLHGIIRSTAAKGGA